LVSNSVGPAACSILSLLLLLSPMLQILAPQKNFGLLPASIATVAETKGISQMSTSVADPEPDPEESETLAGSDPEPK
jgi:hypothetical protein